jgi:hypothetical protein
MKVFPGFLTKANNKSSTGSGITLGITLEQDLADPTKTD